MRSRALLNLFMLGLMVILGLVAYFKPGKHEPEVTPLAALDTRTMESLTLRNTEQLVFSKQDGRWSLTEPFAAPANQNRVEQLLEIPRVASEARYPVNPDDLSRFELSRPKAVLLLGGILLEFGGTNPISSNRYVRVGETLHLVKDNFFHHLTAGVTDFVDKALLPEGSVVNEIAIPGLKAVKAANGTWSFTPVDGRPDINELVFLWSSSRAIEVRRLQQPVKGESIHIGMVGGAAVDFIIVQREPSLLLARADLGLSYEVMPDVARGLLNQPSPATASEPSSKPTADKDAHHEHDVEPE